MTTISHEQAAQIFAIENLGGPHGQSTVGKLSWPPKSPQDIEHWWYSEIQLDGDAHYEACFAEKKHWWKRLRAKEQFSIDHLAKMGFVAVPVSAQVEEAVTKGVLAHEIAITRGHYAYQEWSRQFNNLKGKSRQTCVDLLHGYGIKSICGFAVTAKKA